MLCEQERLNNELIVEDWLLAALTVLIRSDLGFGGTVDGSPEAQIGPNQNRQCGKQPVLYNEFIV